MFTQQTSSTDPTGETSVKTLVVTDLVDSTAMIESLGDQRAAEIFERHNIAARELLSKFNGLEIDRTDGFLLCFDRPIDAVRYALAYHDSLAELSGEVRLPLTARAGIHLGEILLRKNKPEFVARGAKALEAEGLAKPVAARIMSLAMSGQTLMTQAAFDLARRAAVGHGEIPKDIQWMNHGQYSFKGVDTPQAVCEVGRRGLAPLSAPPDSEKVKRAIAPGEEETLGWRPAVDLEIPGRSGWTLQRKLGDGGFGEVWLVRHKKAHSQKAFKFCFQADRLRGLKRELTLFRLMKETLGERSDIARLYEVHLDAPPFYLEMEYTEGGDLTDWANARGGIATVPLDIRLEIVAQTGVALAAAHSVGVIHKDVKPANILIHEDRRGGPQARLTDFGIGQLASTDLLLDAGITVTAFAGEKTFDTYASSHTGTRLYMAPELLTGGAATIQSDIHALGVLLYQIVIGDFTRPLAHGWESLVENELLREDIAACVAGEPSERLSAADLLSHRLRTVHARKTEREREKERLNRERHRRRLLKLSSAVGAVLAIVAAVAGLGFWQTNLARELAEKRHVEAEAHRAEAERQREIAQAINDFMNNELLGASDPENTPNRNITVREVLDTASRTIAGSFADEPLVEAAIRTTLGNTYARLGEFDSAEPHLQRALEIQRLELGYEHRLSMSALTALGSLCMSQGRLDQAASLLDEAIAKQRRILGEDDSDTLNSMALRATLFTEQGRHNEAEKLLVQTVENQRRVLGQDHQDTLRTMQSLASFYWRNRRLDEAEPLYAKVAEVRRETLGKEHPRTLVSNNSLALIYGERGRLDEAEQLFLENTRVLRRVLGDEHRDTLTSLNNLADLYKTQGRFDEAIDIQEELTETRRRVLGPEHPDMLKGMNNLAIMYFRKDRFKEAEELFKRILPIRQRVLGVEHPDTLITMNSLALLYNKQHRFGDSEALQLQTIEIQERTLGETHSDVLVSMFNLAGLYNEQEQYEKADPVLATVVARAKTSLPAGHWHIGVFMYLHGSVLKELGRYDEAERSLLEAHGILTDGLGPAHSRTISAIKTLANLYDEWERPEKAGEWRKQLPTSGSQGAD